MSAGLFARHGASRRIADGASCTSGPMPHQSESRVRRIVERVAADAAGSRLDRFVRELLEKGALPDASNAFVRRLIVAGAVRVNGRVIRRPAFALASRSQVEVFIDPARIDVGRGAAAAPGRVDSALPGCRPDRRCKASGPRHPSWRRHKARFPRDTRAGVADVKRLWHGAVPRRPSAPRSRYQRRGALHALRTRESRACAGVSRTQY